MDNLRDLAYKPGWVDVIERLRALYERRAGEQIFATKEVPSRALEEFRELCFKTGSRSDRLPSVSSV